MLSTDTKLLAIIEYLEDKITNIQLKEPKNGIDGRDGVDGRDGRDGRDGIDGTNGKDGQDGTNGTNGTDGVSVVSAEVAFDNHLVLGLSDGTEIDAGEIKIQPSEETTIYSSKGASHVSSISGLYEWLLINYPHPEGGESMLYSKLIDADGNYRYIGEATAGTAQSSPTWRIQRVYTDPATGDIEILWANGTTLFDKVWDNRITYSYS